MTTYFGCAFNMNIHSSWGKTEVEKREWEKEKKNWLQTLCAQKPVDILNKLKRKAITNNIIIACVWVSAPNPWENIYGVQDPGNWQSFENANILQCKLRQIKNPSPKNDEKTGCKDRDEAVCAYSSIHISVFKGCYKTKAQLTIEWDRMKKGEYISHLKHTPTTTTAAATLSQMHFNRSTKIEHRRKNSVSFYSADSYFQLAQRE